MDGHSLNRMRGELKKLFIRSFSLQRMKRKLCVLLIYGIFFIDDEFQRDDGDDDDDDGFSPIESMF